MIISLAVITSTGLAIASLVVSAASAAVSAVGAYQQGKAQKKMANFNAKMAERNAVIQRNNALQARRQASLEADKKRAAARRYNASMRANALKSGSTISGSVADILYDSALNQEQEALTEIYKGTVSGQAYLTAARDSQAEGELTKMQGNAAYKSGLWQAGGALLQGASSTISSGYSTGLLKVNNPKPPIG